MAEHAINVHTATLEELQGIWNVGPKRAGNIIACRGEDGSQLDMVKLINATSIGQTEWARLVHTKKVHLDLSEQELMDPSCPKLEDVQIVLEEVEDYSEGVENEDVRAQVHASQHFLQSQLNQLHGNVSTLQITTDNLTQENTGLRTGMAVREKDLAASQKKLHKSDQDLLQSSGKIKAIEKQLNDERQVLADTRAQLLAFSSMIDQQKLDQQKLDQQRLDQQKLSYAGGGPGEDGLSVGKQGDPEGSKPATGGHLPTHQSTPPPIQSPVSSTKAPPGDPQMAKTMRVADDFARTHAPPGYTPQPKEEIKGEWDDQGYPVTQSGLGSRGDPGVGQKIKLPAAPQKVQKEMESPPQVKRYAPIRGEGYIPGVDPVESPMAKGVRAMIADMKKHQREMEAYQKKTDMALELVLQKLERPQKTYERLEPDVREKWRDEEVPQRDRGRERHQGKGGRQPSRDGDSADSSPASQYPREDRRGTGSRPRSRSPAKPKLLTFHGETERWPDFYFMFKEVSRSHQWSLEKRRNVLMECMRDKAISFVRTLPREKASEYQTLKKALCDRYGNITDKKTLRRQLVTLKQREDESVEQFADYVYQKVTDAFPRNNEDLTGQMAVEYFLGGCRDKLAAYATLEKEPQSITEAVRVIKTSMANLKATGRSGYHTRQVSFEQAPTRPLEVRQITSPHRSQGREGRSVQFTESSDSKTNEGTELVKQLGESIALQLQKLVDSSIQKNRSVSPIRNSGCFQCGDTSHFARECPKKTYDGRRSRSPSPGSPRSYKCFECGEVGHFKRECPRLKGREMSQAKSEVGKEKSLNG
jgi:hypothetical protein